MRASTPLAAMTVALLAVSSVVADEPRNQKEVDALIQSSFRSINGRETPELVPYHIRFGDFFSNFAHYSAELRERLSQGDFEKLSQFASSHGKLQKQDADTHLNEWKEIAARAEPMSAVEIATALNQSSTRIEGVAANRYRAVLDSLTSDGKAAVDQFVFARVRPMTMTEDPLVVAIAAPIFYKTQILGVYKMMQNGQWPPPPPQEAAPRSVTSGDAARIATP